MKIEIDLGETIHGQPLQLVAWRHDAGTPWVFDLVKMPGGQRDDKLIVHNMPLSALEAMGRALAMVKGIKE